MDKNRKIDYIIIGAQKSGTTSLHDLLVQHPKITTTILKENLFFSKSSEYEKGNSYLWKLFPNNISKEFIIGTSDVQLLHSIKGVERVYKHNPNIKLIIVLRDPVDRAYSAYNFAVQKSAESKNISFEERYNQFTNLDLKTYIRKDDEPFDYFYDSFYYSHLKRWESYFSRDNMYVTTFDNLKNTPEVLLDDVFSFLNVNKYRVKLIKKSNVTGSYRFGKVQNFIFNGNKWVSKIGTFIGVKTRIWIRKNIIKSIREKTFVNKKIDKLDPALKIRIGKMYKEDSTRLKEEYKIEFPNL